MRRFVLLTILAFALGSGYLFGATDDEIWQTANSAYDNGDFAEAIDGYRSLLERGQRTAEVYYNLGNAYFKAEQIGLSIASFHHSLKLDPSYIQAKENLAYVRQYTIDKVEEKPRGFLINIWYGLAGIFSPTGYFIFTIVVFWCLVAVLTALILGFGKKEFFTYLLILLAIMFILGVAISYSAANQELNTKWGVLTATSAELREGPGEDFEKIFTGHEGLEFKILSQRQGYYLVELNNGLKGWIRASLLTEI